MTASTSHDRSVSDDALASGGPAGDGGFDPSKPFMTRDGREVINVVVLGDGSSMAGNVVVRFSWNKDGSWLGHEKHALDLVNTLEVPSNTPIPTVPPTPAGDMAGEDDAAQAIYEARVAAWIEEGEEQADNPPWAELVAQSQDDAHPNWENALGIVEQCRLYAKASLAREGARREPVAGDGWQPIETAPRAVNIWVVGGSYTEPTLIASEGSSWSVKKNHMGGLHKNDPTHWHPQIVPAAPGVDANGVTTPATPSEEALCRTPKSDALVDRFAASLKAKLRAAAVKYGYGDGWVNGGWEAVCRDEMHKHLAKGDPLDVAAFCAFAWHHGWPTTLPSAASPEPTTQRDYLTRDRDIILEAINSYDGWLSDDDFDAGKALKGIMERMRYRAEMCGLSASPDGEGSGSEPVADDELWNAVSTSLDALNKAIGALAIGEVRRKNARLSAVPPASVDAVAVVTEWWKTQSFKANTAGFALGCSHAVQEIIAALRARQPVEAPGYDAAPVVTVGDVDAAYDAVVGHFRQEAFDPKWIRPVLRVALEGAALRARQQATGARS